MRYEAHAQNSVGVRFDFPGTFSQVLPLRLFSASTGMDLRFHDIG